MSYIYIHDSFLKDKKYQKDLARIEARLTELGIKGKTFKLSFLKSPKEIIEESIRDEAKTIVACGNDQTLTKVLNAAAESNIVLGYIPFEPTPLARLLGIPPGVLACDVLSNRLIKKIDLGKVNDQYFLSSLQILGNPSLECDGKFKIQPLYKNFKIKIWNLGYHIQAAKRAVFNPQDGYLQTVLAPKANIFTKILNLAPEPNISIFPTKKLTITGTKEGDLIQIDNQHTVKTPAEVEVVPSKLKIIVGKERLF